MSGFLLLFPTLWDARQLEICRGALGDIDIVPGTPADSDCPWDFDLAGYLERMAREFSDISGVASTSDYPGAAAAAILADRLGLSGPPPTAVLRAGHKYLCRMAQKACVPEAVPAFHLVDPRAIVPLPLCFPCFVKPVKGAFSVLARRMERPEDLPQFLSRPAVQEFLTYYVHMFEGLLESFPELEAGARYFLAEELLAGTQVTVEGYASGSEVHILGVVDSIIDPRTGSFLRFDYPSHLDAGLQARLGEIAARAMRHLGWRDGCFNVEMMVDPKTDRLSIIEVNPRLCGQFADLHRHVDGVSTYEVLVDLALGRAVTRTGTALYGAASSFPLRIFEPARAEMFPGPERIREIEARFPGTLIWIEGRDGDLFEDFELLEDGQSARYGIVNVAGNDHREVLARFREIESALGCRFSTLVPATRS